MCRFVVRNVPVLVGRLEAFLFSLGAHHVGCRIPRLTEVECSSCSHCIGGVPTVQPLNLLVQEIPVLLQGELLVVTDWRPNNIGTNDLFSRVVKLTQERMVEDLDGCWSFLGVEVQQLADQVHSIMRNGRAKPLPNGLYFYALDGIDHGDRQFAVQRVDVLG